jgi:hypothetical protein
MTGEPRYTPFGPVAAFAKDRAVTCQDCGSVVTDQAAHTRFHSILSGHAWALAVLKNAHLAAHVHDKYNVVEKINSRTFDSWSGDALAEVIRELERGSGPLPPTRAEIRAGKELTAELDDPE